VRASWRLALALSPVAASAQAFQFVPRVQPEFRIDAVAARKPTILAGFGANVPAGYYLRVAASAVGGMSVESGDVIGRAELVGRYLTDPFRQMRWGAYGGGGLALIADEGERRQAALILVAGVEFPGATGWRPSLEVGFGGGTRVGVVFKPARRIGR
jgi:hypothetical protein